MKILYIEDNAMDADLARRALTQAMPGLQIHLAVDLAAARRMLDTEGPFDAVLTDLRLPDGSGLELLAEIRRQGLALPVIILTGSGDQASAMAALKTGADDYLTKRSDYLQRLPHTLTAAINSYRAASARRSRPLRVLYVEHNAFDVDLTQRHFAQHAPHLRLEVVASAAAALARLPQSRNEAPVCDVVLMDYRLGELDALELTKVLRQERGLDLPLVLVTGQGSEEIAAQAMRLGVNDYLTKHNNYLYELTNVLEKAYQQVELAHEQTALRDSEAKYRRLVEGLKEEYIFYQHDTAGKFTYLSPSITNLLGYMPDDFRARYHELLTDAPINQEVARRTELSLQGIQQPVYEVEVRHQDGSPRRLEVLEVPLFSDDGTALGVYGIAHDITARKQAEERLRQSAAVFESTRDGVIITDLDANIVAVNRAFQEITGFGASEVQGQNPRLLQSGRHDRSFYQGLWASVQQSGYWQGEIWNRRKDGEIYPEWLTISTVYDPVGAPTHYVGVSTDISRLKRSEEQLAHLAHYDPLTDLPNRLLLQSRLAHAIERAERQEHRVGVLSFDLDRFKNINDSLGHTVGDELLQAVVERLRDRLHEEDTFGRLGGDEFLVILEPVLEPQEAAEVARDLLDVLAAPLQLPSGHEVYVSASIGISIFPDDSTDAAALLRDADTAMNKAKDQGRNRFCFYTADMNNEAVAQLQLEAALRRALANDEFVLHYQPKVNLRTGCVVGAEALIRWQRDEQGMIPPGRFIPLAEKTGLIVPIGTWVIDRTCRQLRAWHDAGMNSIHVALNISAQQFSSGDLPAIISRALQQYAIPPETLELELTESALLEDHQAAERLLHELKALGVRISLDDFGTGYSSLAYLSRFPIDTLKIDRSFVQDIVTDPDAAVIALSIIELAHRMNLTVIAEGVETEAQLSYLRTHRCDEMQGYYVSRPVEPEAFIAFLQQGNSRATLPAPEPTDARTLLIVDDEPNILSTLRRMLRNEGYRILTAPSAQEGLELLAQNPVQVILSDQRMPEMNGTEFLARVKRLHPNTVRIVLSGYTDLQSVTQAINEGAIYKFLLKPWEDEHLRGQIRDAFLYHEAVIRPQAGLADSP